MSNDFYAKLGKKIYKLRKLKKISREKFAEIAGINDYYLGEIERGEKHASLDILFKIARQLHLKIHELVNIEI
ncbi:helix-turn-helix transcriptional regulator [bacterium]|nr:helix-turn-helix transcriptional regulator [bacterium]